MDVIAQMHDNCSAWAIATEMAELNRLSAEWDAAAEAIDVKGKAAAFKARMGSFFKKAKELVMRLIQAILDAIARIRSVSFTSKLQVRADVAKAITDCINLTKDALDTIVEPATEMLRPLNSSTVRRIHPQQVEDTMVKAKDLIRKCEDITKAIEANRDIRDSVRNTDKYNTGSSGPASQKNTVYLNWAATTRQCDALKRRVERAKQETKSTLDAADHLFDELITKDRQMMDQDQWYSDFTPSDGPDGYQTHPLELSHMVLKITVALSDGLSAAKTGSTYVANMVASLQSSATNHNTEGGQSGKR